MEQGVNLYENLEPPVPYSEIQLVLLTHSHIDHVGMLPYIYAKGISADGLLQQRLPVISVILC